METKNYTEQIGSPTPPKPMLRMCQCSPLRSIQHKFLHVKPGHSTCTPRAMKRHTGGDTLRQPLDHSNLNPCMSSCGMEWPRDKNQRHPLVHAITVKLCRYIDIFKMSRLYGAERG
ncbi:hypothetical protein ILYODFUR_024035 [Ilyodon furcidens]|uniref:Uncharacterized protein n=1 Tax=Ilyodon furcidens TaxID=33524 RepID=A0ABV0SR16_9TELE